MGTNVGTSMWSPTTKEMPYQYDYDQQVPTERPTGSHPHPVPSHPPPADGNAGATSTGTAAGTGAAADDLSVSVGSTHAGSAAAGAGSSSVMRLVGQIAQESDNLRTELAKSYALTHAMSHGALLRRPKSLLPTALHQPRCQSITAHRTTLETASAPVTPDIRLCSHFDPTRMSAHTIT